MYVIEKSVVRNEARRSVGCIASWRRVCKAVHDHRSACNSLFDCRTGVAITLVREPVERLIERRAGPSDACPFSGASVVINKNASSAFRSPCNQRRKESVQADRHGSGLAQRFGAASRRSGRRRVTGAPHV